MKYTTMTNPQDYVKLGISVLEPNGEIDKRSIEDALAFFKSLGIPIPSNDKLFDTRAREEALKEIGRYDYKTR